LILDKKLVLRRTRAYAKRKLCGEHTGHDWFHTDRVLGLARRIASGEGGSADLFIVELAALLHDVDDWKFSKDELAGARNAGKILKEQHVPERDIERVCGIIENISFKGARTKAKRLSLEGRIVQDADRLDAMGAIGIARAFAYGGMMRRQIYDPKIRPRMHKSAGSCKNARGTTINHFYEKLLLLKDRMNTRTGKRMAKARHAKLERFVKEFKEEWIGKD